MLMLWLLTALFAGTPALAVERLAVLELAGGNLTQDEHSILSDEVRGVMVKTLAGRVQVMTRENMEVMLSDMGIDAACVAEGACEVETARNLGVDYVVTGSVGKMGDLLMVSLKLHDTGNGQLLASERAKGSDSIDLLDGIPAAAAALVELWGPPAGGTRAATATVASPAPIDAPPARRPLDLAYGDVAGGNPVTIEVLDSNGQPVGTAVIAVRGPDGRVVDAKGSPVDESTGRWSATGIIRGGSDVPIRVSDFSSPGAKPFRAGQALAIEVRAPGYQTHRMSLIVKLNRNNKNEHVVTLQKE